MKSKKKAVVFDLDSTLCDCSERHHHVLKQPQDFDTFHSLCGTDKVNMPVRFILDSFAQKQYSIVILTGRPERYLGETVDWLVDHRIEYDQLVMKRATDERGDVAYKRQMLSRLITSYDIVAVFEDRKKIVDMIRDEFKLTVFDVAGNLY